AIGPTWIVSPPVAVDPHVPPEHPRTLSQSSPAAPELTALPSSSKSTLVETPARAGVTPTARSAASRAAQTRPPALKLLGEARQIKVCMAGTSSLRVVIFALLTERDPRMYGTRSGARRRSGRGSRL